MIPAYVVNQDFEAYKAPWQTDNPDALTRVLAKAELYIDRLGSARRVVQPATNTMHKLEITGDPTGGTIDLDISWGGVPYTVNLPFYATSTDVIAGLRAAGFPGTLTIIGGPLPYMAMYIVYGGSLGGLPVPQGAATSNLTGGNNPAVLFDLSGTGGATGKRFDFTNMLMSEIRAVKNAVCAQADYMMQMDNRIFEQAQYDSVSGPAFTTKGKLPVIAPQARRELAAIGMLMGKTRAIR